MGGCRRPKAFYICALRQANQTSLTRSRVTKHPLHVERKGQSTHTKGRAVHEEDKHGKHVRAGHCLLVVNDIYSCVLLYVHTHTNVELQQSSEDSEGFLLPCGSCDSTQATGSLPDEHLGLLLNKLANTQNCK